MITYIVDENQKKYSKFNKLHIVLSKVMDDNEAIKYQDLKNMFLSTRHEGKQEAKRNKIRKEEVKKQFPVESQKQNKSRFYKQNEENIIVNFSFLTRCRELLFLQNKFLMCYWHKWNFIKLACSN